MARPPTTPIGRGRTLPAGGAGEEARRRSHAPGQRSLMDILLEQLVYGSFPFWDRGYDVLARSPGCRPDWVSDVLGACRQFGEAPSGVPPSPCLFATRLASGPWAVVGVEPMGHDDRGRPGALAFHALLIHDRDYRRAGSNPFVFSGALRRD